jgi:hypothetical protein
MGLPTRQRRVLDHIDRALRGSDPRLSALYAIFGRLTREEPMPRFEQLRTGLMVRLALIGAFLAAIGARLHFRPRLRMRPRQRAILLYPLAIALAVGSIVLAARSSSDKDCLPVRAVAAAKNVAKSSLCQSPPRNMSPLVVGH